MKSNKGYTLVELIVAVAVLILVMAEVGALMVNSQKLYRNGYYEVNLQENSQQVVQTVQDLLMNANVVNSLTTTTATSLGGIKSDIISFQTDERRKSGDTYLPGTITVSYKIGRKTDLVPGTVAKTGRAGEYTDLVLVRNDGTETISLIAEGVQSIYLTKNSDIESTANGDMFNVKTADVCSIAMNMANESYRYSSSGEVYLRNKIGTGGDPMPDGGSGSAADVDITVLRIHEYDLKKFIPSEFTAGFAFKNSADGAYYELDTATGIFSCKLNLNSDWSAEKECDLIASSAAGETYKIHITTPKVNDGTHMPIYTWSNTTAGMINAIPVNGICTCPDCREGDAIMDAQITLAIGGGSDSKIDSSGSTKTVDLSVLATNGENGFTVRRHKDENASEPIGSAPAAWNFTSMFDNEVFNRVKEGEKMNMHSMWFSICPMKEIPGMTHDHDIWEFTDLAATHQYRCLYYEYLLNNKGNPGDPYGYGNTGQHCFTVPHPDSTGANCFADFELGRIHVDNKANGFSVNTTQHADASSYYWDYMVDNNSYVRLHIWAKFKGLPDDDKYIYDCYGYFFPQSTGSQSQHDHLMNIIMDPPSASDIQLPVTANDPHPYTYYDMNH